MMSAAKHSEPSRGRVIEPDWFIVAYMFRDESQRGVHRVEVEVPKLVEAVWRKVVDEV